MSAEGEDDLWEVFAGLLRLILIKLSNAFRPICVITHEQSFVPYYRVSISCKLMRLHHLGEGCL